MISLNKSFHIGLMLVYTLIGLTCISFAQKKSESSGSSSKTQYKFDFGKGKTEKGYIQVLPEMTYTKERGFGFYNSSVITSVDHGGKDLLRGDFCTSDKPFYFTVDLPEGNYNVTVILGDKKGESTTTVKAESRRLMLEKIHTQPGQFATHTFTVNTRTGQIDPTNRVKLKAREKEYLNWDNQLTLEFNNTSPKVCAIEIAKTEEAITIYLAGNSTVVDQDREPWAAWGQMIPRFFKPGKVAIANHAESGEALKSFYAEKRLEKILSVIKPGDYLFVEFAHNDQKQGYAYVEPFTTYKEQLKLYISEARKKGAIPVLVTSMHRRNFDENGKIVNTLLEYPEGMRQAAKEENVPLIDLNAMSKILYEAWGPEKSIKAFVHYPAGSFPGQDKDIKDNTHFSTYGAYELAKCIVKGIKESNLGIAQYLVDDIPTFDPANPDPIETWNWPLSPMTSAMKPDGN